MVKILKNLASEVTDNQLAVTIRESANQIWLAGLGAFVRAQEEGTKVFSALVKEGQAIQGRTGESLSGVASNVTSKASGSLDKLEKVFEDRVGRALKVMGVPTHKDVEALSERITKLTKAVEKLTAAEHKAEHGGDGEHKAAKPAKAVKAEPKEHGTA